MAGRMVSERSRRVVLLVENDEEARERLGSWLEDAGYEVLGCPGPTRPDYVCVAGRGGSCPLAKGADAIVLDTWLASDAAMEGTSSEELLAYYQFSGKPVLVLQHSEGLRPSESDAVSIYPWPPRRESLVEAVAGLLES